MPAQPPPPASCLQKTPYHLTECPRVQTSSIFPRQKCPFVPKEPQPTLTLNPLHFDSLCPGNTVLSDINIKPKHVLIYKTLYWWLSHCGAKQQIFPSRNKTNHRPLSILTGDLARGVRGGGDWCGFVFKFVLLASKPSACHCQASLQYNPSWALLVKELVLHLSNRR